MAILATELKLYKSKTVDDSTANGGRMSTVEIVDGVIDNLWPAASQAERLAGSTKYRKTFLKIENALNLDYLTPQFFVETHTPGDDIVSIFLGTQRDTQAGLTGAERLYGAGNLATDVAAGATQIVVNTEDGTLLLFRPGDLIRISDQVNMNDATGNEEYLRLDAASGAVTFNVDQATLILATGVTTANAYLASATKVASCIEPGAITASVDNKIVTSTGGTYDEVANPVAVDHTGGVEETWTFTFTSATTFDVVGDTLGAIGSGSTSADFIPVNPDFSKPYFTLLFAGWGGTWATGETMVFQTHPASAAIWEKKILPAGAASISANSVVIGYNGESA